MRQGAPGEAEAHQQFEPSLVDQSVESKAQGKSQSKAQSEMDEPILSPTQEHYLKRELLKLQCEGELERFNNPLALRSFGFPFTDGDPREKTLSTAKPRDSVDTIDREVSETYPMIRFFFTRFVATMPFLSPQHQDYQQFWAGKVQVFYEHFMSMSMSESLDREETTKRKKMARKLEKLVLTMFNSGVGTVNEAEYYSSGKLALTNGVVESKRFQKLLFQSKETLQAHLAKGEYVNGIMLNVCGVRKLKKANNKFLSGLNLAKTHETHYEFVIKTQLDISESQPVFVSRRYTSFKELHSKLKKKFPGKQLPKLPSKVKSIISLGGDDEGEDDDDYERIDDDEDEEEDHEEREREIEEEQMAKKHDDEIRKNLSQLFQSLKLDNSKDYKDSNPKTPTMPQHSQFDSNSSPKTPKSPIKKSAMSILSPRQWTSPKSSRSSSQENRLPREKTRVGLRSYLRNLIKDVEIAHCDILREFLFKDKIHTLSSEDQIDLKIRENLDLLLLLNQVRFQKESYAKITKLKEESLPLRAKLLESDNGLVDLFQELKTKEHVSELSPMLRNFIEWSKVEIAATIYIMFLGNDNSYEFYSQVKRLHRLMPYSIMINILRFTNPMSIMKAMMDLLMANPFGGKSLLQTLFYGILSDDMKSQTKVITELEQKIGHTELIDRLKYFVYDCTDSDLIASVKREAKELQSDVVLTVMISPQLYELSYVDDDLTGQVFESYNEYKRLLMCEDDAEQLALVNQEKVELYSNLKSLYKLYVRNRDKEIMQQLWSEPELISILKELFTMFYKPLVSLFSSAHVDVAFRNFESFMDDLIHLIDHLSHEMYVTDTSKIVDSIMKVIDSHVDEFYQFVHETYVHDKQGLFDKLIRWISDILSFLRHAKDHHATTMRINLQQLLQDSPGVDVEAVLLELDVIIANVKKRHEKYQRKLARDESKSKSLMDQNWKSINDIDVFKTTDFGINEHDLMEMEEDEDDDDEDNEQELERKSVLLQEPTTENIEKLVPKFRDQLIELLKSYS